MKIEIEVHGNTEDETIDEAVLRHAGWAILQRMDDKVRRDLSSKVSDTRTEMIRERLEPILDEAMEASVQRTNEYGEPKGDPVTLRELITEMIRKELTFKTDRYGDGVSALSKLIKSEIERKLDGELRKALDEGKKVILDQLKAHAAQVMTDAMERATR